MQIPKIPKAPDLEELLAADPDYAVRYEQCLEDIQACSSMEALKHCKSPANHGKGYVKEWNSHHGMLQRAAKQSIPLSPELRDFAVFLAHVGPKPHYNETGKLSLDKTNSKGYVIGFIRWENPEGQTRNRSSSRFHLYKGRYYTDSQLAALLTDLGEDAVKGDTVKKRRLRGKTTAQQFAMASVAYESGLDPVSDWDFPAKCAAKMQVLYRKYHRKSETRLAFFIRWLHTNEIPRLDSTMQSDTTPEQAKLLDGLRALANIALHDARANLKILEQKKITKEIADSIYQGCTVNDYMSNSEQCQP
jgi:hypothetical protein